MIPISALLLDLDGTLVDSLADIVAAANAALVAVGGKPLSLNAVAPHVGNGLEDLVRGVMGAPSEAEVARAVAAFGAHYAEHCVRETRLYPGVEETLARLHGHIPMAVVTNKPERFARTILERLGASQHFGAIVGGDSGFGKKPAPGMLTEALGALGLSAAGALMVGDGPQDVQAARAAGTRVCVARYGFGFTEAARALEPDFSIDHFQQLEEIVLCPRP